MFVFATSFLLSSLISVFVFATSFLFSSLICMFVFTPGLFLFCFVFEIVNVYV